MRSIQDWLDEYNKSHQHHLNKALHWVCVPLIMFSLLGLLWAVKIPVILNLSVLIILLAIIYYLFLSPKLTAGMALAFLIMILVISHLEKFDTPLWLISIVIFSIAWIGQFIGHYIEGAQPSFFKDLQFLLIGPLWLLSFIYKRLRIPY